ncbi:hypothetical protein ZHAS_00003370 [Anopheles sinensis]|uniref:Uncharacterized protein n=1 Tax=Anopheles sinensis TaxID=74873 RepID=A0A084VE60_ANOSI|nr:hypothetical protein ZHAS_00003370 [Anopheles sinensis]
MLHPAIFPQPETHFNPSNRGPEEEGSERFLRLAKEIIALPYDHHPSRPHTRAAARAKWAVWEFASAYITEQAPQQHFKSTFTMVSI